MEALASLDAASGVGRVAVARSRTKYDHGTLR